MVAVGGMVMTNYPMFDGRLAKKNLLITEFYFVVGKIILYVSYINTTTLMYEFVLVRTIGARKRQRSLFIMANIYAKSFEYTKYDGNI
jgi:hypothetical protein